MNCVYRPIVLVAITCSLAVLPSPAKAQTGGRLTVALGPVLGVQDAPLLGGGHARLSAGLWRRPRPLSLVIDTYLTWLLPNNKTRLGLNHTQTDRTAEAQWGVGASGLLTLFPSRRIAPYALVGLVHRWSSISVNSTIRDAADSLAAIQHEHFNPSTSDLMVGLGATVRAGSRRLAFEARLYGGSAYYVPLTVGFSF